MKSPAPLYTDAFALCEYLLGRLGTDAAVLPRTLCRTALGLLEAVALALKGRGREANLDLADERLIALRVHLRLAGSVGHLSEEQMLHALTAADQIGRQLGGWRRTLGPA